MDYDSDNAGDFGRAELDKTMPFHSGHRPVDECTADLKGKILGSFRLEKEIARGGMGIVIEAHDLELDREVAIKLLLKQHRTSRFSIASSQMNRASPDACSILESSRFIKTELPMTEDLTSR